MSMMTVSLVAVLYVLCVKSVGSFAGEPSCPAGLYEQRLLEYAIESKSMLKTLEERVKELTGTLDLKRGPQCTQAGCFLNDDIQEHLKNLSGEVNILKGRIDELQTFSNRGNEEKDATPVVAFSALLSASIPKQNGYKNVMKLDKVISNVGGHFNTTTGAFTVPLDGLYHFTASLMANNDAEIWGFIQTPTDQVMLYARGTDGRHDQGSQSVITALKSGDQVTLHGGPLVYGGHYSSFSGFLMR